MQTGKKKKPGGGTNTTLHLLSTSRSLLRQMRISCCITLSLKNPTPVSKLSTLKDKWKFYQWVVLEETESEEKNESVLFFFF